VQASPSGHAAPLHVDISLPFKVHGRRDPPAEQLPLLRLPDGSIKVRHERQHIDTGKLSHSSHAENDLMHTPWRAALHNAIGMYLQCIYTSDGILSYWLLLPGYNSLCHQHLGRACGGLSMSCSKLIHRACVLPGSSCRAEHTAEARKNLWGAP